MFLLRKFVLGRAIFFIKDFTNEGDTLPIVDGLARVFVRRLFIFASVSLSLSGVLALAVALGGVAFLTTIPGRFFWVVCLDFAYASVAFRIFADILSDEDVLFFLVITGLDLAATLGIVLSIPESVDPLTYGCLNYLVYVGIFIKILPALSGFKRAA